MASDEHPNVQALERFLEAIPSVSRPIVHTQKVNGDPIPDGFTTSWHDPEAQIGFTALAFGEGRMKVFIEFDGDIYKAADIGRRVSKAIT